MKRIKADGKRSFIVVVSEMIPGYADPDFAKRIQENTGIESRYGRLAHLMRGGNPSLRDRVTAAKMGSEAVKELICGKSNLVICERNNRIVSLDINLAQTADRIYKGKVGTDAMNHYPEEDKILIKEIVKNKKRYFKDMYKLLEDVTG
jgi:6-phosphofructokinase